MGKGVKLLAELLTSEEFDFDLDIACKIHNAVGLEEAFTWGKFRNETLTAFYNSGDPTNMVNLLLEYAGFPQKQHVQRAGRKPRM